MAEVEETIKRIQSMKGVKGIVISSNEGIPIKSTMSDPQHLSCNMKLLMDQASRVIKDLDTQNDISMIRLHTKRHEILSCTDPNTQSGFMMTVVQENGKTEGHCD